MIKIVNYKNLAVIFNSTLKETKEIKLKTLKINSFKSYIKHYYEIRTLWRQLISLIVKLLSIYEFELMLNI